MSFKSYAKKRANSSVSYTPVQVARAYQFPTTLVAKTQVYAAIGELGGGHTPADIAAYFKSLGLPAPNITVVSVDGATSQPGGDADGEVMGDIEVLASVFSSCFAASASTPADILLFYAPNTSQGFIDLINAVANHPSKPVVLSLSWGGPESPALDAYTQGMNAALQNCVNAGITVCVAAGDNGSSDGTSGNAVDFPGSSPYVLNCGGTSLILNSSGTIASEVVWEDSVTEATGGGISALFPVPSWQAPVLPSGIKGRGCPDVAGNADPATGYILRVSGQNTVIGGTSMVAPLYAGLILAIAAATGRRFGLINPLLYDNVSDFRDVVSGSNGNFSAGAGYDFDTGLGSVIGTDLLATVLGTTPPTNPTPPTPPTNPVKPPPTVTPAPALVLTFPNGLSVGELVRFRSPKVVAAGTYNVVPVAGANVVVHAE